MEDFIKKEKDIMSDDKKSKEHSHTLDQPRKGFEVQASNLGTVDLKINHVGNRLAVTSIDYGLSIYNISDKGLSLYRENTNTMGKFDACKIDFNPVADELMSGTLSLKTYDIPSGEVTREFHKNHKAVSSVAYVIFKLTNSLGAKWPAVRKRAS